MTCTGAEAALMMKMQTGHQERSLALQKQIHHPAGEPIANHVSHHLKDLPEAASETAILKETGSRQADLLTDMVKTEPALLTGVHPKQMRKIDGAGRQ